MNELVQLIKVNLDDQTVIGRELHATLKIKSKYADWIKNMIAYGFVENKDYHTVSKILENGGRTIEHILSLSMAKEICMLQRTPEAKQVREYLIDLEEKWNNPEYVWARAVKMADLKMKQLSGEIMTLNKRIEEMKPKAEFADAIIASNTTILVGDFAKILKQNGIDTGQNRLFKWFVDNHYLFKRNGQYMPTQRAMELELFKIDSKPVHIGDETQIKHTVRVTPQGQKYFINKLLKERNTA